MDTRVWVELIRLVPTLVWAGVVLLVLLFFGRNIRTDVIPRLTHVEAFGVKLEASIRQGLEQVAASTPESVGGREERTQVARRASRLRDLIHGAKYLLVNDNPREMLGVVRLLDEMAISVTTVESTEDALMALERDRFDVVNSDMRRGSNVTAGLDLLREMRSRGHEEPVILTVGHYEPGKGVPAHAFGITNRVDELLNLVFDALERVRG